MPSGSATRASAPPKASRSWQGQPDFPHEFACSRAMLAGLRRHSPNLDRAIELAEAFAALVRERAPERLNPWLQAAQDGPVPALRRFAKRLQADGDAVRAAVTLGWSNGQTEGQINRLKTLKRQMYGRAGLDLLERRFLLAA